MKTTFLLVGLFCVAGGDYSSQCLKNVVSDVFCLPEDYRRDVPPLSNGPLNIFLKLPITEISEIDDHKSQITIRMAYKVRWPEHRLVLNFSADWSQGEINVPPDLIKYFWTPDIIIHDLVSFTKPEVLTEVAALEIIPDHSIYYKVRSDITIVCKGMKFAHYPMDKHVCDFKFSSYGYDESQIRLSGKFSYERSDQRIMEFHVDYKHLDPRKRGWMGSSSNYSVWGVEIILTRSLSPFILSVYLPSGLFVIMSWVSFFIPPEIVQARIVLLITLCLVLINMFNLTVSRIPIANSVTAMEVWILACILLVFIALIEYAVILRELVKSKRKRNRRGCSMSHSASYTSGLKESNFTSLQLVQMPRSKSVGVLPVAGADHSPLLEQLPSPSHTHTKQVWYKAWDRYATFVFPLIFSTWNVVYWFYFLSISV